MMHTPPNSAQKGQPITARWLNQIKAMLLRSITGGSGILVQYHGDRIVISQADSIKAAGGGGSSIRVVDDVFPAIPNSPTIIQTPKQKWECYVGYTRWYPMSKYTTATGVVGSAVDTLPEE